ARVDDLEVRLRVHEAVAAVGNGAIREYSTFGHGKRRAVRQRAAVRSRVLLLDGVVAAAVARDVDEAGCDDEAAEYDAPEARPLLEALHHFTSQKPRRQTPPLAQVPDGHVLHCVVLC